MPGSVRLSVADARVDRPLIAHMVSAYAQARQVPADDVALAVGTLETMVDWVVEHAYPSGPSPLDVVLRAEDDELHLEVRDKGRPLASFGGPHTPAPPALEPLTRVVRDLHLENLGSQGKKLACWIPIPLLAIDAANITDGAVDVDASAITYRLARSEDAADVGALVHTHYQLNYPHEFFYDPEALSQAWAAGNLVSSIGLDGTTVVAHGALFRPAPGAAPEIGSAIVHPAYRSRGLGQQVNQLLYQEIGRFEASAVMVHLVTLHTHSQAMAEKSGFVVTGLLLGAQPPGVHGDHARLSVATAYLVLDHRPREVALPTRYASVLAVCYDDLGLPLVPQDPEVAALAWGSAPGIVRHDTHPALAARVTIWRWTPEDQTLLLDVLRDVVRGKAPMCFTDLDLHTLTQDELDEIVDILRTYDDFAAGLMPFGPHGHDYLRMQAILSDDLELDSISLASDRSRAIRELVFNDHDQLALLVEGQQQPATDATA